MNQGPPPPSHTYQGHFTSRRVKKLSLYQNRLLVPLPSAPPETLHESPIRNQKAAVILSSVFGSPSEPKSYKKILELKRKRVQFSGDKPESLPLGLTSHSAVASGEVPPPEVAPPPTHGGVTSGAGSLEGINSRLEEVELCKKIRKSGLAKKVLNFWKHQGSFHTAFKKQFGSRDKRGVLEVFDVFDLSKQTFAANEDPPSKE